VPNPPRVGFPKESTSSHSTRSIFFINPCAIRSPRSIRTSRSV